MSYSCSQIPKQQSNREYQKVVKKQAEKKQEWTQESIVKGSLNPGGLLLNVG